MSEQQVRSRGGVPTSACLLTRDPAAAKAVQ